MRASRGPWWLYFIAASFVGYFTFQVYAWSGDSDRLALIRNPAAAQCIEFTCRPDSIEALSFLPMGARDDLSSGAITNSLLENIEVAARSE